MSLVNDYLNREAQMQAMAKELEEMRNDPKLQQDVAFRDKLMALMNEYGMSSEQTMFLIDPQMVFKAAGKTRKRKPRCTKVYKNPNTGEVIKTRGGNHKVLKSWKEQYGNETVESWVHDVIHHAA